MEEENVDFLSLLSKATQRRILENSTQIAYPAGATPYHPDGPPRAFLIERGLARAYWSTSDGRQATVAFVHPRELVGGTAIVDHPPWTFLQVVVDSTLISLDLETVRRLATQEIEVLSAVAMQLATRVRNDFRLIAIRSLGNIRERLACDILDRACRSQLLVGRLEVRATHQELADSIGSSREVVSRALKGLRAEGIITNAPTLIQAADPIRLATIVRAFVI